MQRATLLWILLTVSSAPGNSYSLQRHQQSTRCYVNTNKQSPHPSPPTDNNNNNNNNKNNSITSNSKSRSPPSPPSTIFGKSIWSFESLFPEPIQESKITRGDWGVSEDANVTSSSSLSSTLSSSLSSSSVPSTNASVNVLLSQKVSDSINNLSRKPLSNSSTSPYTIYDTSSLKGEAGVAKFRDGVRLGRPLSINIDLLNHSAKKMFKKGSWKEAIAMYEEAIGCDPRDGRAYVGIATIYRRKLRDVATARKYLKTGLSYDPVNPYLLQVIGALEESVGHLSKAERHYIDSAKSCSYHVAAWIGLAQLRTRKLGQGGQAGRVCYMTAERELRIAGRNSSFLYTAWGGMEVEEGDHPSIELSGGEKGEIARKLFLKAIDIDPRCSAAWLQLGVMEGKMKNYNKAKECFETVLTFDPKNSRVMQAYAVLESRNPKSQSRSVIELFERAVKASSNRGDAGTFQAYALYVAKLGDLDAARVLLRKGTEANPRHPAVWQAWGVLETRYGKPTNARKVFQQGIWNCAQSGGGQSGGRRCAILWQAWGVLESKQQDYSAARRCFSRALDADRRNVPAIVSWALMENSIGETSDARALFERALKQYSSGSNEAKTDLWAAYERMEVNNGNLRLAEGIRDRSVRDKVERKVEKIKDYSSLNSSLKTTGRTDDDNNKNNKVYGKIETMTWIKEKISEGDLLYFDEVAPIKRAKKLSEEDD